jgi:hypothetical protein
VGIVENIKSISMFIKELKPPANWVTLESMMHILRKESSLASL